MINGCDFPRVHIVLSRARLTVRGRGTNMNPIVIRTYESAYWPRGDAVALSPHSPGFVRARTFLSFTPGTDIYTRDRPTGIDRNDFRLGLPHGTT